MSKTIIQLYSLLFICLNILISSLGYAASIPDSEIWDFGRKHSNFDYFDFSFSFPSSGQFDNGAAGWTVDGNGTGQVISYSNATEGWVGIRCSGGQWAAIEFGPISMSQVTTGTSRPAYAWDQICSCLHFRGNPLSPYNSNIAGVIRCEFFDASGSPASNAILFDASSAALNGYYPVVGLDSASKPSSLAWASFTWQFTPPHQSWYRISKVRISYSVPSGVAITSEVQFDQIYTVAYWFKNP